MPANRRTFLKIGALGVGATGLSGATSSWWGLDQRPNSDPDTDGDKVIPTFCELCFWKCGVLAHVKDGRVTKLVGNPQHPLSGGKLCPRGVGGTGLLYDPDRLKKPLIRVGKRGEERFEEVSWEVALDKVADGMDKLRRKYGPESLALFSHGFGGSWFSTLVKAFGTQSIGQPSFAQCRGPREAGFALTFGSGLGSPEPIDIANAQVITLIGAHLGENMHNTQVQEFADAVDRGAQLVVVDPRFSVAAGKARYWLPIKPGTDIALMLAWMNVIIEEKRYDAEYIGAYASGFDELKAHVAAKTPEWAWPITGIEPQLIRDSARLIASARPASLIHPGRHVTWYGDDSQRARAMAILTALLGAWGRKGGYVTPHKMPVKGYPGVPKFGELKEPPDRPKGQRYVFSDEVVASGLRAASFPGKADYDIKGWMIYGTNLIQSLPNPKETIEAMQKLDFIVAIDVLPAEICGWADVVLPECTYLEREDDLYVATYAKPFVALRQKVVEPLFESKPGWWIAKELAKRLGLEAYFPFEDGRSFVKKRAELSGYDWDRFTKTGVVLGGRPATCQEEGLMPSFSTESGKIELYSKALQAAGLDPLPNYFPQNVGPAGSFRLLTGRAAPHTFGRTTNNRVLARAYPENEVWINADAAKALPGFSTPLKSGEKVVLVNQDGVKSLPVKAKVTERIRGDCVYMVHGWGHTAKGLTYARGRGASDSDLVSQYKVDPVMGGTGTNLNFVRFERPEAV
jgi:thiosulfate reductase/polysulfide reductase chain A